MVKKKKEIIFRLVLLEVHAMILRQKAEIDATDMHKQPCYSDDTAVGQGVSVSKVQFAAFRSHL